MPSALLGLALVAHLAQAESAQTSQLHAGEEWTQTPNSPTLRERWRILARGSSAVVKAKVLRPDGQYLIDPTAPMWIYQIKHPDGRLCYAPVPRYTAGTLALVRIEEVFKKHGQLKPGDVVQVYFPGYSNGPWRKEDEYLLLLTQPIELWSIERERYGDWHGMYGVKVFDSDARAFACSDQPPLDLSQAYSLSWDYYLPAFLKYDVKSLPTIGAVVSELRAGDFRVHLAQPKPSTVDGVFTLAVRASGREMSRVQYHLDETNLAAEVRHSPHRLEWDTRGVEEGRHQLRAIAYDATGGIATSSPIDIDIRKQTADARGSLIPFNPSFETPPWEWAYRARTSSDIVTAVPEAYRVLIRPDGRGVRVPETDSAFGPVRGEEIGQRVGLQLALRISEVVSSDSNITPESKVFLFFPVGSYNEYADLRVGQPYLIFMRKPCWSMDSSSHLPMLSGFDGATAHWRGGPSNGVPFDHDSCYVLAGPGQMAVELTKEDEPWLRKSLDALKESIAAERRQSQRPR